jgi:hypothetical protein
MSSPPKRTATDKWNALVDQADEGEMDRILALSDEALDQELASAGVDPKEVRAGGEAIRRQAQQTAADLDRSEYEAFVRAEALRAPARKRRRIAGLVALLAAVVGGVFVVGRLLVPAPPAPPIATSTPPDRSSAPTAPEPSSPEELRRAASDACDGKRWSECLGFLDQAERLDPGGDANLRVQRMRGDAAIGKLGPDAHISPYDKPRMEPPEPSSSKTH